MFSKILFFLLLLFGAATSGELEIDIGPSGDVFTTTGDEVRLVLAGGVTSPADDDAAAADEDAAY